MNADGTIVARKLCKSYGRHQVLRDIDLTVAAGEISCIIGPSGSGKSTLLRCINGLETIDRGVLKVNGEDFGYVEKDDAYHAVRPKRLAQQRTRIGMVFQQFNLFPNMTAEDNVMSGPVLVKKKNREASREQARELLAKVGLDGCGHKYPASSPAASSNAWPSPARSRWNPPSCCSTNPPAHWTPNAWAKYSPSCVTSPATE